MRSMLAGRPGYRAASRGVLVMAMMCTGSAWAQKNVNEAERAAQADIQAHIEEVSTALKAAVISGALSGEEATKIYEDVMKAAKAGYVRDFAEKTGRSAAPPSPKMNVARLMPANPDRLELVRVLLEPEFLQRDLRVIKNELDLDRTQMTIVEVLFKDYAEAHALAAAPLIDALPRYRSSTMNSYIGSALEGADFGLATAAEKVRGIDAPGAGMSEALAELDREKAEGVADASEEDRRGYEDWKQRMRSVANDLEGRLEALRARTRAQLADLRRADHVVTADDLLRAARALRTEREQLRTDFVESIALIATDVQKGVENRRFDATFARLRIVRWLPRGRLGGESMDLWTALGGLRATVDPGADGLDGVEARLGTHSPLIAAALDARTDATIDRELAALEYQSRRDQITAVEGVSPFELGAARRAAIAQPYAKTLRAELAASVGVRDALLQLLAACVAGIEEDATDADLASAFNDASLRLGFPVETRRRWAERAMAAAAQLDDLSDDVREALPIMDVELATELRTLRTRSIERRVRRDPKLARDFIASEYAGAEIEFDDEMWREIEYAAFDAIDDRTESRLRTLLTPAQFASLPPRPGAGKGESKGKGKGEWKSDGKGTGKGASGKASDGKGGAAGK